MDTFENISQEKYDRLKIFLIANFNMTFQSGESSDIEESFEIITNSGKITGNYRNDSLSFVAQNSESEYRKIIEQIQKESPDSKKIPEKNSDVLDHESLVKEYVANSKKFYEHIASCNICRQKLAEIWDHLYPS